MKIECLKLYKLASVVAAQYHNSNSFKLTFVICAIFFYQVLDAHLEVARIHNFCARELCDNLMKAFISSEENVQFIIQET